MSKLMLNDIKINTIPIHENNEPLVDLKDQQYLLFGSPPDTSLTYNDYTKIRKSVYEKLLIAQNMLSCNWKFKVYEGLRSLRVQKYYLTNKSIG